MSSFGAAAFEIGQEFRQRLVALGVEDDLGDVCADSRQGLRRREFR